MLRRGVQRSLRELYRSISPDCVFTPREILRVKLLDFVPSPFLRMTRGLVPHNQHRPARFFGSSSYDFVQRLFLRMTRGLAPHNQHRPARFFGSIRRTSFLRPFLRMTRGWLRGSTRSARYATSRYALVPRLDANKTRAGRDEGGLAASP